VDASPEEEWNMSGRTALVTGSTDGIGVAIARTLAAGGAQVIVCGRNTERGEQVIKSIRTRIRLETHAHSLLVVVAHDSLAATRSSASRRAASRNRGYPPTPFAGGRDVLRARRARPSTARCLAAPHSLSPR
jgi:NAD(P)-dependent dehydrogenase (short-subunit alcohol dehydrogenase family)